MPRGPARNNSICSNCRSEGHTKTSCKAGEVKDYHYYLRMSHQHCYCHGKGRFSGGAEGTAEDKFKDNELDALEGPQEAHPWRSKPNT